MRSHSCDDDWTVKIDRGIWLGALAGTLLGGALALATREGEPNPPLAREPFRPIGALAAAGADASLSGMPEAGPAPLAAENPPTSRPARINRGGLGASEPRILSADRIPQEELRCARGTPSACLDVGQAYAASEGGETRALTFRRRALVLYAEGCQRREAQACRQLSALYEHGVGVSRDANTAAALLQRYLELCASSQGGCQAEPTPKSGSTK